MLPDLLCYSYYFQFLHIYYYYEEKNNDIRFFIRIQIFDTPNGREREAVMNTNMNTNINNPYSPANPEVKDFIRQYQNRGKKLININAKDITKFNIINVEGGNSITNFVEEITIETENEYIALYGTLEDIINAKAYALNQVGKEPYNDPKNIDFTFLSETEALELAKKEEEIESIYLFNDVLIFSSFSDSIFFAVKTPSDGFIEEMTLYVRKDYDITDNRI